jgi:hypothetical protein
MACPAWGSAALGAAALDFGAGVQPGMTMPAMHVAPGRAGARAGSCSFREGAFGGGLATRFGVAAGTGVQPGMTMPAMQAAAWPTCGAPQSRGRRAVSATRFMPPLLALGGP